MYGIVRKATRILLNVDDAAEFYQEVHKKIENIETVSEQEQFFSDGKVYESVKNANRL